MLLRKFRRTPTKAITPEPDPKASCGCLLQVIDLFDGHPASCTANAPKPFREYSPGPLAGESDHCVPATFRQYDPVAVHQVDGVTMPLAGPRSPDLDRRWCDLTGVTEQASDMVTISRCWSTLRMVASAMQDAGTWYWWIDVYPQGFKSWDGKLTELGAGTAIDASEVIRMAEEVVDEYVIAILTGSADRPDVDGVKALIAVASEESNA